MKTIAALLLLLTSLGTLAEDVRYISDQQFVPLRSGGGNEYRIVHRGLPSGTQLTILEENSESGFARVTTANGTEGWIRTQYLMSETPARLKLKQASERNASLDAAQGELKTRLAELQENYQAISTQLEETRAKLAQTSAQLTEITKISGNALALDSENRTLIEETELLKSRIDILSADNTRLSGSTENQFFLYGAFAVLIGVFITLLVPRLWPKRRSSSSWA